MESHDLGMCERFKEIRTLLKMKQGDFAKEIKTMPEFDKGYLLGMGEAMISQQREKHEEQTA